MFLGSGYINSRHFMSPEQLIFQFRAVGNNLGTSWKSEGSYTSVTSFMVLKVVYIYIYREREREIVLRPYNFLSSATIYISYCFVCSWHQSKFIMNSDIYNINHIKIYFSPALIKCIFVSKMNLLFWHKSAQ